MPCTHYLPVGITSLWAPLLRSVVRGLFRRQQYRGLIAGKCVVFLARAVLFLLRLPGHPRTVQEYVRVGVQGPEYLGFRPADGLSVDCRRMGYFVSDSFGGAFPNPVPATLEIRAS